MRALGWMGLPACEHLYIDNVWLQLGIATRSIRYLPNVTIEHCHPLVGKAQWDEGYRRVNDPARYLADEQAYESWRAKDFVRDVDRVMAVLR